MARYFRQKRTRKRHYGGTAVRKKKKKKTKKQKQKQQQKQKKSKRKRNNSKKAKFNKDSCSPVKDKDELMKFTCYTKDALKKLKNLWNARHPDIKIKTNNPKKIWEKLKQNMGSTCNRESCWLKQKWLKCSLTNF